MENKFLKKKIACLNRKTGELTLSKEAAKHYQVGQELLFSKIGADLSQYGWYSWDKKTKTAIEIPCDAVFHDSVNKFTVHCKDFVKMLSDDSYPYEHKPHMSIRITKISDLKKEQTKNFLMKTLSVSECIPLFKISDEIQRAKQNKPIIKQKFNNDLDTDHWALKKWQEESLVDPTIEKIEITDPNHTKGNIYIFGTYKEAPSLGIYNEIKHEEKLSIGTYDSMFGFYAAYYNRPTIREYDEMYPGHHLHLSKENLKNLGRTEEYNFLSNAYQKDLVIPRDEKSPYRSVYHYLLCKRIEKGLAEAKFNKNEAQVNGLKKLEILIHSDRSACELHRCYHQYLDNNQIFPLYFRKNMFYGLDNDLKKALFNKFVGLNGKPNEEGRKLLETGNTNLFAGYEIGDGTYGMRFNDYNTSTGIRIMEGANKLGKELMTLREMLREL